MASLPNRPSGEPALVSAALHVTLAVLFAASLCVALSAPFFVGVTPRLLAIAAVLLLICGLTYLLLRAGLDRLAGTLLVVLLWALVMAGASTNGGVRSPAYQVQTVVIFITLWALGPRVAFGLLGLTVLGGLALAIAELEHLLPEPSGSASALYHWFAVSSSLLICCCIQWLVIRQGQKALCALRESEVRYRVMFDHTAHAIVVVDAETGALFDVNNRACRLVGRSREALLAMPSTAIYPPEEVAGIQEALARAQERPGRIFAGLHVLHSSGERIPVEFMPTSPIRAGSGAIIICVFRDMRPQIEEEKALLASGELRRFNQQLQEQIAERERVERSLRERDEEIGHINGELTRANGELTRALRLKDQFLANMSHELRTPLSNILGRSESLLASLYGPVTDQQRAALDAIRDSGQHLLSLISDVLDLAKIEAGYLTLTLQPVALEETCRAALRMVRSAAAARRISVTLSLDPTVVVVNADERRLRQVLINLLANAVKFTPEGGRVGLEVQSDAAAHQVKIAVWDTGIGISSEELPQLFQPFVQLEGGLSRPYEGTGLGLALVARLVQLHGGQVRVESVPGKGSRFSVVLPC